MILVIAIVISARTSFLLDTGSRPLGQILCHKKFGRETEELGGRINEET